MFQTAKSLSGQHPDSDQEPGLLIILLGLIRRLLLTGLITAAVCSVCWFGMQMRLGRFDPDVLEAAGSDGIGVLATGRISGKWTFDDRHPLTFYQRQLASRALPEDADHEMGAALLMSQWVENSTSGEQLPEEVFCKDALLWAASAVAREPHSVLRRQEQALVISMLGSGCHRSGQLDSVIEALQKGSSLDPQNALYNFVAADVCYRSATTPPDHVSVELLYAHSSVLVIHDSQLHDRGLTFLQRASEQTTYMSPHVMNSVLQLARWATDNERQAVQHANYFQGFAAYRAHQQIFIEVVMAFRTGDYEAAKQQAMALEKLAKQVWQHGYPLSASSAYYLEIAGKLNREIARIAPELAESPTVTRARKAKCKLRRAAVTRAQQGLVFNGLRQPVSQGAVAWHFASGQFGAALLLLAIVCHLLSVAISSKSNSRNRDSAVSWKKALLDFAIGSIAITISVGLCFLGPTIHLMSASIRVGVLMLAPVGLLLIALFVVRSPFLKRRLQVALPPAVILGCGMALLIEMQLPLLNRLWRSGAEFTPAHWLGRDVFLVSRGDLPAEFENFARFWLMNRGVVVITLAALVLAIALSCWQSLNAKKKWRDVTANALRSVASHSLESAMILIVFFGMATSITLEKASRDYQAQKYLISAQMQADYSQILAKTLADPKFHAEIAADEAVRELQN